MEQNRPRILVLADFYKPGFKAGGPIQSISNLVNTLGQRFEFSVVTRNRDLGDLRPYAGLPTDKWIPQGTAMVKYSSGCLTEISRLFVSHTIRDFSLIYLNSFFSPLFSILPLLLTKGCARNTPPVLLAPRGEFSPRVLALKAIKKKVFISLAKQIGLHRYVSWHATSIEEEADCRRIWGETAECYVAPNLPDTALLRTTRKTVKRRGRAKFVFISRISRKKNLLVTIQAMRHLRGEVTLTIYGPQEDRAYWNECNTAIHELPPNVQAQYLGGIGREALAEALADGEFFVLFSLGENFGHAIFEALATGCPVITSDQTPWRDLEANASGWRVPISDISWLTSVLQECVDMDDASWAARSEAARRHAARIGEVDALADQSERMLRWAMKSGQK